MKEGKGWRKEGGRQNKEGERSRGREVRKEAKSFVECEIKCQYHRRVKNLA